MYLGAYVLLPEGFDKHPDIKFPLDIFQGHFPSNFEGLRTDPHPIATFIKNPKALHDAGELLLRFLGNYLP
jgi:hypothetical protein